MDIVPSMSPRPLLGALKAFGVFLFAFLGLFSPLWLELSCEIITPWQHCVPTPTFHACNSGVTVEKNCFFPAVPKMSNSVLIFYNKWSLLFHFNVHS